MTKEAIIRMAREAGLVRTGDGWTEPHRWGLAEIKAFANLVAAHKAEVALAAQEPVAIALHTGTRQGIKWLRHVDPNKPLYTAPPKRLPLTDEEIRDLWSWSMTREAEFTATTQQHAFARAIEAAHGIKGEAAHE